MSSGAHTVLIAPVVSKKSFGLIADRGKYTFRVHPEAHKTQIRQAVEEAFGADVIDVNIVKVQSKPKRRGMSAGRRPGWKKAIVTVAGDDDAIRRAFGGA